MTPEAAVKAYFQSHPSEKKCWVTQDGNVFHHKDENHARLHAQRNGQEYYEGTRDTTATPAQASAPQPAPKPTKNKK